MSTETTIIPFVFFGAFIEREELYKKLKFFNNKNTEDVFELLEDYMAFIKSDLFITEAYKLVLNNSDNHVFIGKGLAEMPESMSKKRFKIEIHNSLIEIGLLSKDADPDTIQLTIDLYKVDTK